MRHLRASQVVARLRLRGAAAARRRWPEATVRRYQHQAQGLDLRWRTPAFSASAVAQILAVRESHELVAQIPDVARGQFRFIGATLDLGWPVNWAAPTASQLWRYHLHYFDVLPFVAAQSHTATSLVEQWISANPVHGNGATRDAWHPYVVALRMVNWMLAFSAMSEATMLSDAVRQSMITHALFLERNCETDVGGNHLLKNFKALAIAGCFWDGAAAERWRKRYTRAFILELNRQVLEDGGHYERSPMYHCQVLGDALEVAAAMADRGEPTTELDALIDRMSRFLRLVTHPDGDIALLNDSAFDMAPSPATLQRAVEARRGGGTAGADSSSSLPAMCDAARSSGYVALPAGNAVAYLIADVGMVCPDDLPAHAHSDLTSFEVSVSGKRFVVDSGVGEYSSGPWRNYYRSTRAHNVMAVDDAEQSDCWSSFRVGRRARPIAVVYAVDGGDVTLEAGHTGYDHLSGGVRHHRRFVWSQQLGRWSITDTLRGTGQHTFASYCHFHPDVRIVERHADWLRLMRDGQVVDIHWHGFSSAAVVTAQRDRLQGWYADRFGAAVAASVLVLSGRGQLPVECGYDIVPKWSAGAPLPQRIE